MFVALLAAATLAAQDAPTAPYSVEIKGKDGDTSTIEQGSDPHSAQIDRATALIKQGKATEAVSILDEVIAAEEASHKGEIRMTFAARSMTEALLYSGMAATQKKSAIVLNDTWALGYFLKGFALVDLNRGDEAKTWFDKAIALAPMNAQFLAERGEWHKNRKDWGSAYADFESASTAAEFSPDDVKTIEKGRALRGMAFVRIEQGELREAEKLLKQALKLDPKDAGARNELEYIKSLRGRT